MAGQNGGARPGAGRKPKAEVYENEITKADKRLAKNLIRHIANMERLADGVLTEETSLTGKTYVYTHPPDRAANEYLINRVMGKPTERREVTGQDGGPVEFTDIKDRLVSKLSTVAGPDASTDVSGQPDTVGSSGVVV